MTSSCTADSCTVKGVRPGTASREDEDRLLQGCKPAGESSERDVRLSGVYVSASGSRQSQGKALLQFQSGYLEEGGTENLGRDPKLAATSAYGKLHRRSRPDAEPEASWMVQLLRAIQPFSATAHREACRPIVGSLGLSEIQEAARSPGTSLGLADSAYRATADPSGSLGTTAQ